MTTATKKLSPEVLCVLSQAQITGNRLRIDGQLDRKLYVEVAKAIEALGGKWVRSLGAHVFETDVKDRIDAAILTGEVTDLKVLHQFYETPENLALEMVKRADIQFGERVLEPSAGRGAIVRHIPRGAFVIAVEINPECAEHLSDVLLKDGRSRLHLYVEDFLEHRPVLEGGYDVIVANPPFAGGREVEHVEHMLRVVRAGGRIVTIMSAGILARQDQRYAGLRTKLEGMGATFEPLPADTFKAAGTNVNTVLITVEVPT